MNVWTRLSRVKRDSMVEDSQDNLLPLGNASVTLQNGDRRRFRVNAAILTAGGKHRVRLTFEGPQGSVAINLSGVDFWRLTYKFHEESAAVDFGDSKQPGRRPHRKQS